MVPLNEQEKKIEERVSLEMYGTEVSKLSAAERFDREFKKEVYKRIRQSELTTTDMRVEKFGKWLKNNMEHFQTIHDHPNASAYTQRAMNNRITILKLASSEFEEIFVTEIKKETEVD